MGMKRTYEYRLYPRRAEVKGLNRLLEQCRNGYEATGKGQRAAQAG